VRDTDGRKPSVVLSWPRGTGRVVPIGVGTTGPSPQGWPIRAPAGLFSGPHRVNPSPVRPFPASSHVTFALSPFALAPGTPCQ